jgi:sugar phosphate isomerase/epimerase
MSERCLWAGTLLEASLSERITAAQAGGFDTLSIFPNDYARARDGGMSDADILAAHADAGVRLTTLDPFTRWVPRWEPPPNARPDRMARAAFAEDEFFAIVEALELTAITVIEAFGARFELEELAEAFSAVCDRAARSGARVHLEFAPFAGVPDLQTAWDVVSTADHPNGGLVFDTWHYLRGTRDDALLESIPGERIFAVQVDDAAAEPVGSLINDTLHHRLLPGEGTFDLTTVLGILGRKPGIGTPGIEVLSEELWKLPPDEIGRRSRAALDATLARAGWGRLLMR